MVISSDMLRRIMVLEDLGYEIQYPESGGLEIWEEDDLLGRISDANPGSMELVTDLEGLQVDRKYNEKYLGFRSDLDICQIPYDAYDLEKEILAMLEEFSGLCERYLRAVTVDTCG